MIARFARLLAKLRRRHTDDDLKEELRVHREMDEEDRIGAGEPPLEARRRARLAAGSAHAVLENVRDQELVASIESCYRDFKLGLRGLRKSPVFCVTAILTIGIGIGANTAVFTLLYGLLLRSLPVQAPEELAHVGIVNSSDPRPPTAIPFAMFQEFRRQQRSFVELAPWLSASVTMQDKEGAVRRHLAEAVGGEMFELLGVRARLGRMIEPADDVAGGPAEGWPAVLSYGFWRDHFAGDSSVIGRRLQVTPTAGWLSNRATFVTVVGVAPPGFHGIRQGYEPEFYLPMRFLAGPQAESPEAGFFCIGIGRLRPGVSLEEANAELAVLETRLVEKLSPPALREHPDFHRIRLSAEQARTGAPTFFTRTYATPLYLAQGLVAAVLLLCCVNVGGLMMSKAYERQREFAVRTAIGAARWRLVRQHLTESFVIALAGAALGAGIAWRGCPLLLEFFRHPQIGTWLSVKPDRAVLLVSAASAVLTTLLFGILPAWRAGRAGPGSLLKARTEAGRSHAGGRPFIPVQVSLSLILVAVAAMLSQSLSRIRGEDPGFEVDHVTIQTPPFDMLPQKGDEKLDLYQRMVDRLNESPDILSAAATVYTPMTGYQSAGVFEAAGGDSSATLAYNHVGPGYFETMQTRITAGREFGRNERRRDVCIVNEAAAAALFPGEQSLERFIRSIDPDVADRNSSMELADVQEPVLCRVIGVAEDAKFANLRDVPPPTLYFPLTREVARGNFVFLMRSENKGQAIAAYRESVREIAPTIPLVLFATLREQMDAALGSERVITAMSATFGGLALFLSAIGLYGVLSSAVAQRTAEIGIRGALGASRRTILRMILWDGLRLVGVGVLVGLFGLYFAVRQVEHMLYEVAGFDPGIVAATVGALALVGLAAGLAPALRAASVDPMAALRSE